MVFKASHFNCVQLCPSYTSKTVSDNFVESTITGGIITHFKTYHPKAGLGCPVSEEGEEGEEKEEEEEVDCACPAHSKWDVLMEEKYLNQNLTEDKLTKLKSAWTILGEKIITYCNV